MTSVCGPQGHKWQSRLFLSVLLGLEEEAKHSLVSQVASEQRYCGGGGRGKLTGLSQNLRNKAVSHT